MAEESLIRLSIVVSPSTKGQEMHIQMAELVQVTVIPVVHPRVLEEGDNWQDRAHNL